MTRKLFPLCVVAGLVLASLAAPAFAQNSGAIAGYIYDQSGTPLRGVAVEASSDTQIGGTQRTVTDDQGAFRFQGLFPGKFKLRVAAPHLRTLVQENVSVSAANTVQVDLIMEVETASEEIKLVQKAPMVNPNSTKVGVVFDEDFMNALPLSSRTYQGVAALTPGVTDIQGGNPNVRGGTYFSNKYTVDGFNTTDPVTRTFGTNFSFSSMASLEATTAGGGTETAGTGGGSFNIVTKSGSNRFEFDSSIDYSDQHLQLFKDYYDQGAQREANINVYVGGPIKKDSIWYSFSGKGWDAASTLPFDPNFPIHPSFHAYSFDGTAKLTWRLTQRNQLDFLLTVSPGVFNNNRQDPLIEAEAESRQFQRSDFAGITWQYIGDFYLISRLGLREAQIEAGPQRCQWDPNCTTIPQQYDVVTGFERNNYPLQAVQQTHTVEFSGHTEYIKNSRRFGDHAIKLAWSYEATKYDRRRTIAGDVVYENNGPDPYARSTYCSNDPSKAAGDCHENFLRNSIIGSGALLTLTDAWKPTRYLTLKPGVAFHYGSSQNDTGIDVTDITGFGPHLAVLWDPTHDGKTKLQATVDGVVDTGFLALASLTSRQLYSQRCIWDPKTDGYTKNCRASGGSDSITVGLPCGPSGVNPDGTSCRTKLNPPRVWEATIGGQREIAPGVAVDATFVYRKFLHQWEDAETNANWNAGGTDLRQDGQFKTARSQFVYDLQTPDASNRVYRGVTVSLLKREGRLKGLVAYTLSRYEGAVDVSFSSNFLNNPGQTPYYYGPLATDNRHDLRALAQYSVLPWLSLGVNYQFLSGGPYNHYFYDPVSGGYSRFQAQRGYDSRGNTNPDDDLALRLPDVSMLNLHAQASLERIIKQKVDLWADVLNVLALRTPTSYVQSDGPFFGHLSSRLDPTQIRVGIRYRY